MKFVNIVTCFFISYRIFERAPNLAVIELDLSIFHRKILQIEKYVLQPC